MIRIIGTKIRNKRIEIILLLLIILLAAFLRLWQLGRVPASLDWDEVALGYNAYSLMLTGRDEYAKFLPIVLRSFDDYKPAFYAYLLIPFIKFLGLSEFAVRLPSAIFGILSVPLIFYLVCEIFDIQPVKSEKEKQASVRTKAVALISAFLLAISPWHIQFSRIAFEAQVGLFLNLLGLFFFLKGLRNFPYLVFSAIFASISIYTYQSEKVFLPILFLGLILIFRKEFFSIPKKWIVSFVAVGVVLSFPMFFYLLVNPDALLRARGVSVFSDQTQLLSQNAQKYAQDLANKDYLGIILDNRRIEYAKAIIAGFISHFDLNWLFITGDIARHHAPNMGLLYLFELPFLFIGIYNLVFGDYPRKAKMLVFLIFLIAPIPASVTSGVPHAVRTINFLPTFQIFVALGILQTAILAREWFLRFKVSDPRKYLLIFGLASYILLSVINFTYYLDQYFVQQNYFHSKDWQYGYAQAVPKIKRLESNYEKIIVSNQEPMDQSYMFFLFYLRYPPSFYQKEVQNASGGFRERHKFGKYEFRPIEWEKDKNSRNTLLVGKINDFSSDINIIDTFFYPNGEKAIVLVGNE